MKGNENKRVKLNKGEYISKYKNYNSKKIKQDAGITVIALIVIIVVLLILASITIPLLTGENGVINKATSSKDQHEVAGEKETLKLAVSEAYHDDAKTTKEKSVRVKKETLKSVLENSYSDKVKDVYLADDGIEGVEATFIDSGRTYLVETEGNVTEITDTDDNKSSGILITKDGVTETVTWDNARNYYGDKVDYHPSGDQDGVYRVFYYDSEGKFGPKNMLYLKRDVNYDLQYSVSVPSDYKEDEKAVARTKRMNPLWAEGATSSTDNTKRGNVSFNKLNGNEKFAVWLCDERNWTKYVENRALNVIGSPSVEMYCDSYNSVKHNNSGNNVIGVIYNNCGYTYTLNNNNIGENEYNTLDSKDYNGMYTYNKEIDGATSASGWRYWDFHLASPSTPNNIYDSKMCGISGTEDSWRHENGGYPSYLEYTYGVCPLVCLKNKNVHLYVEKE